VTFGHYDIAVAAIRPPPSSSSSIIFFLRDEELGWMDDGKYDKFF
jgi:hypothetical protein